MLGLLLRYGRVRRPDGMDRQDRGVQDANDAVRERFQTLLVQARAEEEMVYEVPNVPAIQAGGAVARGREDAFGSHG